jgi:hypothetical protein
MRILRFSRILKPFVDRQELEWRDDVTKRLDLLMQSQTQLLNATDFALERSRPSRPVWIQAVILLALTVVLVSSAAVLSVRVSSLSSRAATLNGQAQIDSLQATQELQPLLDIASRSGVQYMLSHASGIALREVKIADDYMHQSNLESAQANKLETMATTGQIAAQVTLALSSAFLGAILGWIVTQILAELRWRRRGERSASSAAT